MVIKIVYKLFTRRKQSLIFYFISLWYLKVDKMLNVSKNVQQLTRCKYCLKQEQKNENKQVSMNDDANKMFKIIVLLHFYDYC